MQKKRKGLAAALLVVCRKKALRAAVLPAALVLLAASVSGCRVKEEAVFTAGGDSQEQDVKSGDEGAAEQDAKSGDEGAAEQDVKSGDEGAAEQDAKTGGEGAPGQEAEASGSAKEAQTEGYVYICGAVQSPGVYPVHASMRVFEAVSLAGGFAADADEEWLNQAETVQDGQKLYIYTKAETAALMQAGASPAGERQEAAEDKVNINTADAAALMTLPGIGEAKAESIIQYRNEHGPFSSIEEIQEIPGIKQAVFSKIEDRITV